MSAWAHDAGTNVVSGDYQRLPVDADGEEITRTTKRYRWGLNKSEYYVTLISVAINAVVLLSIIISTLTREPTVRWKGEHPTYCESFGAR